MFYDSFILKEENLRQRKFVICLVRKYDNFLFAFINSNISNKKYIE